MSGAPAEDIEAWVQEGLRLHRGGNLAEARIRYERALQLQPRHAGALHLLSLIALQANEPERALALIRAALELNPDSAVAHGQQGAALAALRRHDEALASYDRAIRLDGHFAEAHYNRGTTLLDLMRPEEAIASFEAAIVAQAGHLPAHFNRGAALAGLNRYADALGAFDTVIALDPRCALGHRNRGLALFRLGEHAAAIASFDAAIALDPADSVSHYQRGTALRAQGRPEAAIHSFDRALELDPGHPFLRGLRLHTRMQLCAWDGFDLELAELTRDIERGAAASPPLPVLTFTDSAAVQKSAASAWVREMCLTDGSLPPIPRRAPRRKIRIGYFSADFRDHAVANLMAGVFESHDRSRFEVAAFAFGPEAQDTVRARLERAFDRFLDVRARTDREIAALARELEIDVAVDLGGFTEDCRTNVFAFRAAPVQVGYLGYPGTLGAGFMDYLIADAALIPSDARPHYSEKIVYLPSFQANDRARRGPGRPFTRGELGLPERSFVFCCFNGNTKITPDTFRSWLRILSRVPESVLFLYAEHAAAADNLRREAERGGISAGRLIFGGRLPAPEYLSRYRVADLFLDTMPYNAGTTASDALWMGLPVLTLAGGAFASRMGASLLCAVGLPELLTTTPREYEALAVELATDAAKLAELKRRLMANRDTARLFDTAAFTRDLEAAFAHLHARWHAGLPPDHVLIDPTRKIGRVNA
jgi:predicted O-linked N-acetylglucosamine transferase (SPINDLY family)